jgi:5-(carboxyamino)imidazole ribonucleotide synthase
MNEKTIEPGGTIGILGSGQLGRMLALEARAMGYRVHVFSPDENTPAGQVADLEASAPYEDTDALTAFVKGVDVVTLEFENIPAATLEAAEAFAPVRPGVKALHVAQNRLREKTFLFEQGFPVVPFRRVVSQADLDDAIGQLGTPAVLKTAGFGYDGKGQAAVDTPADAQRALEQLGGQEAVLEAFIPFEREVSVVAARGLDKSFAHYGLIENRHERHILDLSVAPPELPAGIVQEALEIARGVLEALEVAGVMCIEFFVQDGRLIINEIAPRTHNSGHLTIDACVTSQFAQQLRAVCGLPLGSTEYLRSAAMTNLLGDLWQGGTPNWRAALALPGVKLHLYGKAQARPGRKMGHLTVLADTPKAAIINAKEARARLARR